MSDEVFKKLLIYILKNYRIFYQDQMGRYEEYQNEESYNNEKNITIDKIKKYEHLKENSNYAYFNNYGYNQVTLYNLEISYLNYEVELVELKQKMEKLFNIKTFKLDDDYSLEEIANELSKIGSEEYEDDEFENTNLNKLKNAMYLEPSKKLKFIRENIKK